MVLRSSCQPHSVVVTGTTEEHTTQHTSEETVSWSPLPTGDFLGVTTLPPSTASHMEQSIRLRCSAPPAQDPITGTHTHTPYHTLIDVPSYECHALHAPHSNHTPHAHRPAVPQHLDGLAFACYAIVPWLQLCPTFTRSALVHAIRLLPKRHTG